MPDCGKKKDLAEIEEDGFKVGIFRVFSSSISKTSDAVMKMKETDEI